MFGCVHKTEALFVWPAQLATAADERLLRNEVDAAKPEFGCRFAWRNGSIAFWDNRATWHYALNDYQGERRLMHRITIEGCELLA